MNTLQKYWRKINMTVNEIITNANNLTNAEKHTMRTIL